VEPVENSIDAKRFHREGLIFHSFYTAFSTRRTESLIFIFNNLAIRFHFSTAPTTTTK
jgi:hypothetical protein